MLYDESPASSSSSSTPSTSFTPRLLLFDEPDALGPGLFSSNYASSSSALDDDAALAASAATWGGRAVAGVQGGAGTATAPSAFAAALAAAEREERRRRLRRQRGGSSPLGGGDGRHQLAAAARALSLSGGVSSWADFLKAPLAKGGTVHSDKALGWLPPFPPPTPERALLPSSSSPPPLSYVPGARRPGWAPPPDSPHSFHEAAEEGARRLAERCDRLGGFLTFADDARGWGSTAAAAMATLRDEYPRSPRVLFALRPPDSLFQSGGGGAGGGGGGGKTTVSASAAAAFSTGVLAPLVDVFVPLSPPSPLWSCSSSSSSFSSSYYPCDALFRWSAAAASVIDAATTPLRLLRGDENSSSSSSLGGFGAASLAALLAGPRGGSLAALSAALPLSPVASVAAASAAAAAAERRQQREKAEASWASPPTVSCWTPVLSEEESRRSSSSSSLFAEGSLLAESATVRGALSLSPSPSLSPSSSPSSLASRRLSAPEALSALEAALIDEGSRAVRQLCASSAPLHLPLPFPEDLLPAWCYARGGGGGGGGGGGEGGRGRGKSGEDLGGGGAPALVRLAASRALSSLARASAGLLTLGEEGRASSRSRGRASGLRSSRTGEGGASSSLSGSLLPLFLSWGVDADDAAASAEASRALEDEYRGAGSDGVLSSFEDDDDGSEGGEDY